MSAYLGERQQLNIRVPAFVKERLRAKAVREGVSLTRLVAETLQYSVRKGGRKRKLFGGQS